MKIYFLILVLVCSNLLFPKEEMTRVLEGTVSYISSQNVYVKFKSTEGIKAGDTLFIKEKNNYLPAIKIDYTSSTSCAGVSITNKKIELNTLVYAFIFDEVNDTTAVETELTEAAAIVPAVIPAVTSAEIDTKTSLEPVPTTSGRVSIQSYSNFTNQSSRFDYQRWRYTFQLNANRIGGSGFSYSQYLSFAYRASDWNYISSNLEDAFRVYDLAMNYSFNDATSLWFGRHLNSKISNVGPIDGMQFETGVGGWSFGAAVGSRPTLDNMGWDFNLFEYGAYVYRTDAVAKGDMFNTLGYFTQTNDFKTDRRFIYYQHSNSAIENTRIFLSTEIDLYKIEKGESQSEFSLTSLYTSINIRPSDLFSLFLSYDARKNVIYYETFKSFADSVYENETRQGFRTRLTLKPVKNLYLGIDYGYRFRRGDPKPANNYGGYITYSQIPGIESSATASFNRINSSYVNGDIWSFNLNRPIVYGVDLWLGYRFTTYQFREGIPDLNQQSASVGLSTYLLKPVILNFTYEGNFESTQTSGRFLANLTYRF
ncbi:MAG: hypothetical protein OQJ78_05890 [Ignavibacteriaceae bacterium]|nr:hypothetical protein [Ignavibacteriaceae bacterium]